MEPTETPGTSRGPAGRRLTLLVAVAAVALVTLTAALPTSTQRAPPEPTANP